MEKKMEFKKVYTSPRTFDINGNELFNSVEEQLFKKFYSILFELDQGADTFKDIARYNLAKEFARFSIETLSKNRPF
jgi:hypothetical protein